MDRASSCDNEADLAPKATPPAALEGDAEHTFLATAEATFTSAALPLFAPCIHDVLQRL